MIGAGRTTRRAPRWVVAVLAVLIAGQLLAGLAGVAVLTAGNTTTAPERTTASDPHRSPGGALDQRRLRAIQSLLDQRASAVLRGDKQAFLAGIDPASPRFRAQQAELFDNLAGVPLAAWTYTVDTSAPARPAAGKFARYQAPVWAPAVSLRYRLADFDPRPAERQKRFTFVERDGEWYLAADGDATAAGHTDRALWDFGPVTEVRARGVLVLGHPGSRPVMQQVAAAVAAAVPRVTAVWGSDWGERVVVLVPRTQDELAGIVADGSDLSQIAAVATAELPGTAAQGRPAGERIIVNPANFAKLGALGRRVVLTHEVTHVASRAATSESTPVWLAEGFADYVGYLGTGTPVTSAARELGQSVRAGRLPAQLPTAGDFAGTNPALAQSYEEAWLACRLVADLGGQQGLVDFYRAVSDHGGKPSAALATALQDRLHLTTAEFTARWRAYLKEQLG